MSFSALNGLKLSHLRKYLFSVNLFEIVIQNSLSLTKYLFEKFVLGRPAHFCLIFPWDKFEVGQGCNVCEINRFLVPGVKDCDFFPAWNSMSKGSKMYSPDTMSNPFCNHTALQCVLVHQWLSCGEYQLVSEVKFVLKPVPIISCRKRAAWYKLAPLHVSFEPARALSQIPV